MGRIMLNAPRGEERTSGRFFGQAEVADEEDSEVRNDNGDQEHDCNIGNEVHEEVVGDVEEAPEQSETGDRQGSGDGDRLDQTPNRR